VEQVPTYLLQQVELQQYSTFLMQVAPLQHVWKRVSRHVPKQGCKLAGPVPEGKLA
jgi:hypothetical protein